jgi:hypothetical protein
LFEDILRYALCLTPTVFILSILFIVSGWSHVGNEKNRQALLSIEELNAVYMNAIYIRPFQVKPSLVVILFYDLIINPCRVTTHDHESVIHNQQMLKMLSSSVKYKPRRKLKMLITFKLAKLQPVKEKALQRAHCLLTKVKSAYLLVVEMKLAQMTLIAKLVNPPSLILQPQ